MIHVKPEIVAAWLELLCRMVPGVQQAVLLYGLDRAASGGRRSCWPANQSAPDALLNAARLAAQRATSAVSPATDRQPMLIALPLLDEQEVVAAVAVAVQVPERQQATVLQLLEWGLSWLRLLGDQEHRFGPEVELPAQLGPCLPDCEDLAQLAVELGRLLNPVLGCCRLALGSLVAGSWELAGLSDAVNFDRASVVARALQDELIGDPQGPESTASTSSRYLLLEPLSGRLRLLLQWREPVIADRTRPYELIESITPLLALWLQGRARSPAGISRFSIRGGLVAGLLLLGLAVLYMVPAPFRIVAPARLEPAQLQVLTAPFDGFVEQGLARAGDSISKGQVIARLDGRELSLQLDNAVSRVEELSREYRKAMAGIEVSRPRVLQAQLAQARAQRDLLKSQLERLELVAPFAGILVSGDLSQSIGAPVNKGDVLFELAPDGEQRLVLEVPESSIRHLQPAQMVEFRLEALPDITLSARLERILPAALKGDQGYYYRVEAELLDMPPGLRPGMQGLAKIVVGQRRALWVLTHPLFEWLQLGYRKWLPW